MEKIKVVIIGGPTASGKSMLAVDLSERFNGEVVSADSMQVYRYMDIGTAKPSREERERIPHHMIDAADPDEEFTAARYRDEASGAIKKIHAMGKRVFIVGGTGLYIRALIKGLFRGPGSDMRLRGELAMIGGGEGAMCLYEKLKEIDPEGALRIHPNNAARIIRALEVYYLTNKPISALQKEHGFSEDPYEVAKVGLSVDRGILYQRIEERVDRMIQDGFVEEVRRLIDMGYGGTRAMAGLGYKEICIYLKAEHNLEYAVKEIKKNTRRYAKRQMTWFRKEADIQWFPCEERGKIISFVERFFR